MELRGWLARKHVPEHRHSLWYYFGGLTLFLLALMVASGLLLTLYYEPSAAPAVTSDGTPLAAARVLKGLDWGEHHYVAGDVIALPLNARTGEIIVPAGMKGAVETVKDGITGGVIRPSAAWVSVEGTIMRDVEFGPLVRSVHVYSANLLIATLLIHMFSAFFLRAYRRPRGLMWVTGFILLGLILGFAFTGYLLPWNTLAYFATRIGVSLPESSMPGIGPAAANALRGGTDVGDATLTRMYSAHVVALPMAAILFVILHLLFLQIFGLSIPIGARRRGGRGLAASLGGIAAAVLIAWPIAMGTFDPLAPPVLAAFVVLPVVIAYLLSGMAAPAVESPDGTSLGSIPFYSNFIYRDLLCWLVAFGIIVTLAIAVPWRGQNPGSMPVDLTRPLATPPGIHPEWYFMFAFQLLRAVPGTLAVICLILLGAGILAVPLLDRRAARGERSTAMTVLGIAVAVGLAGLTVWGYLSLATG